MAEPGDVFSVVGAGLGAYVVKANIARHPFFPARNRPIDQVVREVDQARQ
ncbi:MAG TPA: hypothetical protein VG370_09580 [Chloroflexota bacterium]|nr:hypothetical protein [Chloroflexota bacterium]